MYKYIAVHNLTLIETKKDEKRLAGKQQIFKQATVLNFTTYQWGQGQKNNQGSSERQWFLPECRPSTTSHPSHGCSTVL